MRRDAQHRMSLVSTAVAAVAVAFAGCSEGVQAPQEPAVEPPAFGFGNGAPTGAHYNLNVIGTGEKNADMTDNNGHRIFVLLNGKTRILLCESGTGGECGSLDPSTFRVLDANGTDGTAKFALPDPDPTNSGTTVYSVYVRALGKPGGKATNSTCGILNPDGLPDSGDEVEICSVVQLELNRTKGKQSFVNVSKEMLYVYWDSDGDGNADTRTPLFGSDLEGYFWDYDNQGLKLAQFRFYPCTTTVPGGTDPTGAITTTCR